jgi:hypothetical protein
MPCHLKCPLCNNWLVLILTVCQWEKCTPIITISWNREMKQLAQILLHSKQWSQTQKSALSCYSPLLHGWEKSRHAQRTHMTYVLNLVSDQMRIHTKWTGLQSPSFVITDKRMNSVTHLASDLRVIHWALAFCTAATPGPPWQYQVQ